MNRASIWCKRRAEAASGAPDRVLNALKSSRWVIFTANDSKLKKKR